MARRNKPNCPILWKMQEYSTRGWVYREGQGWIFAELMPDERAEFKSYQCDITILRMRVRLPYSRPIQRYKPELNELNDFENWYAWCTMPQAHPLALSRFRLHQMTGDEPSGFPVEPSGYETWLWADEVKFCREVGCEVTIQYAYVWPEWGVPDDWKAPLTGPPRHPRPRSAEYTYIYALIDELTQEVGYVGRSDDPEQRLLGHLRDTNNPVKWAWIQSLLAQDRKPKLLILEKVAVAVEDKREQYWISYYWKRGHHLTNDKHQYWHKPD
jgi:hypothetical protein